MLAALEVLRGEHGDGFNIDVVDIDTDPLLLAQYDERVPVLVFCEMGHAGQRRELCHYLLDYSALRACLAESGLDPEPALGLKNLHDKPD